MSPFHLPGYGIGRPAPSEPPPARHRSALIDTTQVYTQVDDSEVWAAGKNIITGAEVIALQAAEQFERYTHVRLTGNDGTGVT